MKGSNKHLHVISFDIPYPPNYGGVIDVYFKLKALKQAGVFVHLHCYEYGRKQAPELEHLCSTVHYYKRSIYKNPFFGKLPYIVSSRNTDELIQDLLKDDYPILFEGLHTCYYLNDERLAHRIKIVRTHNIEHDYYASLERVESNYFKKYFFSKESQRLLHFQEQLRDANYIAAISPADYHYFKSLFPQTIYLPPFHENTEVNILSGMGKFALYHGNLGVGENDEAARFLVNEVWPINDIPLVIAGNNPSRQLRKICERLPFVKIEDKLSTNEIMSLIRQAQINILPTFQATGIKLKLINALYNGRHCIANNHMVIETGLESLCHIANTSEEMKKTLTDLWTRPFTDLEKRQQILKDKFDNTSNISVISNIPELVKQSAIVSST